MERPGAVIFHRTRAKTHTREGTIEEEPRTHDPQVA
nr:MAG TPA: hypothetical protein [Caudoviricetes sp.]